MQMRQFATLQRLAKTKTFPDNQKRDENEATPRQAIPYTKAAIFILILHGRKEVVEVVFLFILSFIP
jgi:hypothetical protein